MKNHLPTAQETHESETIEDDAARYRWLRDQPQAVWEKIGAEVFAQSRGQARDRLIDEARRPPKANWPLGGATQYD